jgi:hypothetical protein
MAWTKLPGVGQSGALNIIDLVWHNNHWYMLATVYRVDDNGCNYDYLFYEVQDLQTMRRTLRGGPFRQERYPNSSQWASSNYNNGHRLIVYKDKIYFALKDQSTATPRKYWTRVYRYDPRGGIDPMINVFTSEVSVSDKYYDAWSNDICIHNDKLFISCCDKLIRFDGTTWSTHEPYYLSVAIRTKYYGYCDYVSMCSHDGKLYLSAVILGASFDTYYDEYRIMVSTDDGNNFTDVCTWREGVYSVVNGDDVMTSLTSFNDNIYMVTDVENVSRNAIYKLNGGAGSPVLVYRDSSCKTHTHCHLFTTPYDYNSTLYIGSNNKIKSMNTSEAITDEAAIRPYRVCYFISAHCNNPNTLSYDYVGGNNGWVSDVNPIVPSRIYYTEAYSKSFIGYPEVEIPPVTIIDLEDSTPTPNSWSTNVGSPSSSLFNTLREVSIFTTSVAGSTISVTFTPEAADPLLTQYAVDLVTESSIEVDIVSLTCIAFDIQIGITDVNTHHVDCATLDISINPISTSTQEVLGGLSCQAIWNFESGALTVDSKRGNTLNDNYYVSESSGVGGFKRGTCAADFEASDFQYFDMDDSNLNSSFPLKSGDAVKQISVCFWMKPETVTGQMRLFNKYNATIDKRSFAVGIYNSKLQIAWGTGTAVTNYAPGLTLIIGNWYHVAVAADGVNKSVHARVWDDTNSSVNDYTYTPASVLYVGDSPLVIGNQDDYLSYAFDGVLDEMAVFNSLLTSSDIDNIRANGIETFGDTQTSISIEQDLVELGSIQYEPEIFTSSTTSTGKSIGIGMELDL